MLDRKTRQAANKAIHALLKPTYFDEIPLEPLFQACEQFGIIPVDEEGKRWTGWLCGASGSACFETHFVESGAVTGAALMLQWYRMPSNRWEVIGYLS